MSILYFHVQTVALLFQIRIVLRQNNCKSMKLSELIGQLSLLDPKAGAHIFERRIDLLADYKLLKVKLTDEDKIDEVEV